MRNLKWWQNLRPVALSLSSLALLLGCAGRSPPTEFFMLEPESRPVSPEPAEAKTRGPVIALGPIRIAKYLDRPQIVTAQGGNAYKVDERHRWAERLDDNIGRVLIHNLEALVPGAQVLTGIPDRRQPVDFRVALNILEFHVTQDGQALLTAQWLIHHDTEPVLSRTASIHAAASTTDYGRMVAALNECLNRLSHLLAAALMEPSPGTPRSDK